MRTPGNLYITRVTENCYFYRRTPQNNVAVFFYNNRSSQHFFGDRCCEGERQVFFRIENVQTTKETSQETTDFHILKITTPEETTPSDFSPSIWLPILLGTLGFLFLLAFILIIRMCCKRSKRCKRERRGISDATVVKMNNTPEYSTIEKTNDSLNDGQVWVNFQRNSSYNQEKTHSDSKQKLYDGEEGLYNSLFEKQEAPVENCDTLYNHMCEFEFAYNDFHFTEECTREMENAEYSCIEIERR